jgi:hypothetical protein
MVAANNMTMPNKKSTHFCNKTLEGSVLRSSNKQPRPLQPILANEKSSKQSKKNKGAAKKKNSLKGLDDTLQDKDLCSCGLKSAGKCANNQCMTCCSGCPHHKKSKKTKANKRLAAKKKKANKEIMKQEETSVPVSKISQVKVVNNDAAVDESKVEVTEKSVAVTFNLPEEETVEQEEEAEIVPIDIGGKPKDMLGSLIRAIANFPHFCPE